MQFWIQDNHEGIRLGDPDVVDKHAEIRQTINQVKGQQNSILQQLYNEQKCLEGELQSGEGYIIGLKYVPLFEFLCIENSYCTTRDYACNMNK